jgi:hypothetical protein
LAYIDQVAAHLGIVWHILRRPVPVFSEADKLKIRLLAQRGFYRGGVRIGRSTVSTGKQGKGKPTGVFTALLKRESGAEIDLQEVVLRSVDDIPSGLGEDSDVRSKAILESATKVA